MSSPKNLAAITWRTRFDQRQRGIEESLQALKTYAICLQNDVKNQQEWAADRESLTGIAHPDIPNDKWLVFANWIIETIADGNVPGKKTNRKSSKQRRRHHPAEPSDEESDEEIIIEEEEEVSDVDSELACATDSIIIGGSKELQAHAVKLLEEKEREQKELDNHMEKKRAQLAKTQNDKLTSGKPIEFQYSMTDDTNTKKKDKAAEARDARKKRQKEREEKQAEERRKELIRKKKINMARPDGNFPQTKAERDADKKDKATTRIGKLHSLSIEERERIQQHIFIKARDLIDKAYADVDISIEEKQKKIFEKADEMLKDYHESNWEADEKK